MNATMNDGLRRGEAKSMVTIEHLGSLFDQGAFLQGVLAVEFIIRFKIEDYVQCLTIVRQQLIETCLKRKASEREVIANSSCRHENDLRD